MMLLQNKEHHSKSATSGFWMPHFVSSVSGLITIFAHQNISLMKTVDQLNFAGKKALIRVDFNVPLDASFNITDDTRMRAAIPTIKKILNEGGSCILMSHLGRPKEGPSEKYSLKHLVKHLSQLLGGINVAFASDC